MSYPVRDRLVSYESDKVDAALAKLETRGLGIPALLEAAKYELERMVLGQGSDSQVLEAAYRWRTVAGLVKGLAPVN